MVAVNSSMNIYLPGPVAAWLGHGKEENIQATIFLIGHTISSMPGYLTWPEVWEMEGSVRGIWRGADQHSR
jgi:hypothetical protein